MADEITKEKGVWQASYDLDSIRVENKASSLKLFVNDKLQDVFLGSLSYVPPILMGKLPGGKEVRVKVGGDFKMHCYIFVDNECILED